MRQPKRRVVYPTDGLRLMREVSGDVGTVGDFRGWIAGDGLPGMDCRGWIAGDGLPGMDCRGWIAGAKVVWAASTLA